MLGNSFVPRLTKIQGEIMKIHTWFAFIFVLFCAACGGSTQNGDDQVCSFPTQDSQAPDAGDAQGEPEAATEVDAQHEPEARVPTLTIKLNPKVQGTTVNVNDKYIQTLWLDLEGDELEDVSTTHLNLTRSGVGQDSAIQLALLDQDYKMVWPLDGNLVKVDSDHKANFPLNLKIPTKGKVSLVAIAIFSGNAAEQHTISLEAGDIGVDKGVVQGDFPIQGPTFVLAGGPNYFTQLLYEFYGPPASTFKGGENENVLLFGARSVYYEFWFNGWGFDLVALDGGKVRGSQGTFLVKQARMLSSGVNISDGLFMDPANTSPGAESMSFSFSPFQLVSPIVLEKGSNKLFDVNVDFAETEDAPGEFFGHKYRLDLHLPVSGVDLFLATFADILNPGAVEPKTNLQGPSFTIVAP
jgi:hypothetical protein